MNPQTIIDNATAAKALLNGSTAKQRKSALYRLIKILEQDRKKILRANSEDLSKAKKQQNDVFLDRMHLTDDRLMAMLEGIKQIADLPDIVGNIYDTHQHKSGIVTSKMRVPLGVILMIYESRPNVTIDAATLALKTSNAIILKGGSETNLTNMALGEATSNALEKANLPAGAVQVLTNNSRELITGLMKYDENIDIVIPRGSRKLLEFVQSNSRIPVLMHLEGNCHVYVDKSASIDIAAKVVLDSKTDRFGTCNAAESLVVHQAIANMFLPIIANKLQKNNVEIRGDKKTCEIVKFAKVASEDDWGKEYLAPIISIKIVSSLGEAITHINSYGSGHTDSIITEDGTASDRFLKGVDSASVMLNTSTRLADGFEYGLGAEIGISTGKLHARGPVGQEGLTTYKWIVKSDGVTKGAIVNNQGLK